MRFGSFLRFIVALFLSWIVLLIAVRVFDPAFAANLPRDTQLANRALGAAGSVFAQLGGDAGQGGVRYLYVALVGAFITLMVQAVVFFRGWRVGQPRLWLVHFMSLRWQDSRFRDVSMFSNLVVLAGMTWYGLAALPPLLGFVFVGAGLTAAVYPLPCTIALGFADRYNVKPSPSASSGPKPTKPPPHKDDDDSAPFTL